MSSIVDRLRTKAQEIAREGYKVLSWELQQIVSDIEAEEQNQKRWFKDIMDEKCLTDEVHCTCVPILRKKLEAAGEDYAWLLAERNAERARADQLEVHVAQLDAALSMENTKNAT